MENMHTLEKSISIIYMFSINVQREPYNSARNATRILLTNPESGYLVIWSVRISAEFCSTTCCLVDCSLFPVDNASTSENLKF